MGGCGEGKQLIYFQIKVMDCHVSLSILKQDGFLVPLPYVMTESYLRSVQTLSKVVVAATTTWYVNIVLAPTAQPLR